MTFKTIIVQKQSECVCVLASGVLPSLLRTSWVLFPWKSPGCLSIQGLSTTAALPQLSDACLFLIGAVSVCGTTHSCTLCHEVRNVFAAAGNVDICLVSSGPWLGLTHPMCACVPIMPTGILPWMGPGRRSVRWTQFSFTSEKCYGLLSFGL